jgi:hypothetical protein
MHHIGALAGFAAEVLAEQIGDIGFVIQDQNACATRRLPEGQAHTVWALCAQAAAPVLVAWKFTRQPKVNSVNSPTWLSTSIVPPCSWVTIS